MISIDEIRNLSALARLTLAPTEEEALQKDISSILDYVGQVSAATISTERETPQLRNVMRDDLPAQAGAPAETLGDREALLSAFPKREGDFNVVRKILDKDAGAQ